MARSFDSVKEVTSSHGGLTWLSSAHPGMWQKPCQGASVQSGCVQHWTRLSVSPPVPHNIAQHPPNQGGKKYIHFLKLLKCVLQWLLNESGRVTKMEFLSLVQHPSGGMSTWQHAVRVSLKQFPWQQCALLKPLFSMKFLGKAQHCTLLCVNWKVQDSQAYCHRFSCHLFLTSGTYLPLVVLLAASSFWNKFFSYS